jgi:LmbE family N-acetylglucosaminyl deacetylase
MSGNLRLMCVLAHPDDESLGMGGTLAKYASEGVQTFLVTATRGERGRFGDLAERPSLEVVGQTREAELRAAAAKLGIRKVAFLDYIDGDLCHADPAEATAKIVAQIREDRPQVVATFGPEGAYGHPDHIAISQLTTAAIVCAADPGYRGAAGIVVPEKPHRVEKLYHMAWNHAKWAAYQAAFRDLTTTVDGVVRRATPTQDWIITTVIDTAAHLGAVWDAIFCHKTQLTIYSKLKDLPAEHIHSIWGTQEYYRVFSTVNGGRSRETDFFEGLRQTAKAKLKPILRSHGER